MKNKLFNSKPNESKENRDKRIKIFEAGLRSGKGNPQTILNYILKNFKSTPNQ